MAQLISPDAAKLLAQLILVVWMVAVAVMDYRYGRIPNALTAPVILGVGAYRLVEGFQGHPVRFLLLIAWLLIFVLWMLHFLGGGDAKFLMALYALFPSMEFTGVLALILLVEMVPIVLWEVRGTTPRQMGRSLQSRLVTGQVLPTETELQARGRRFAWTFAVPGILYTVFWW
jgi:Flp pilus assembly protein protease CpaA